MADLKHVLDKAAADLNYRARLKESPAAVLREAGLEVPAGATVEVIEVEPGELNLFMGTKGAAPALAQLFERAATDAGFKQRLLTEPRRAIEEATGEKVPASVKVRVHEPAQNRIRVLLPAIKESGSELSDQELEAVAGGAFGLLKRIGDALCKDRTNHFGGSTMPDGNSFEWTQTINSVTDSVSKTWF